MKLKNVSFCVPIVTDCDTTMKLIHFLWNPSRGLSQNIHSQKKIKIKFSEFDSQITILKFLSTQGCTDSILLGLRLFLNKEWGLRWDS